MTGPVKAPKTRKNQPQPFRESAAPALPTQAPARPLPILRALLWVVWAGVAIAVGIGVGLFIRDKVHTPASSEAPFPVATANIHPADPSTTGIRPPAAAIQPALTIAPATSVLQAQAGSPSALAATTIYQPAGTSDTLQPGYQSQVRAQGNIGTTPVR